MARRMVTRNVASALCWALRVKQSHVPWTSTMDLPMITRLLEKSSRFSIIQTKAPNRCIWAGFETGMSHPTEKKEIQRAQTILNSQESVLHPV